MVIPNRNRGGRTRFLLFYHQVEHDFCGNRYDGIVRYDERIPREII
jgi:hypothetical protein